jgi:hypothetical protein
MKKLLLVAALMLCVPSIYAEGIVEKACVKQVDPKTKQEKDVCKVIKVHKKLEGTAVPVKK